MTDYIRKGTGNLLQDLLSCVVFTKKLKKSTVVPPPSTISQNHEAQDLSYCSICSISGILRPLCEKEVEIFHSVAVSSFDKFIYDNPASICEFCSATLKKVVDLKQQLERITTCLKTVIKISYSTRA